jgi:fucose permease
VVAVRRPEQSSVLLAYAAFVLVGLSAGISGVLLPEQIRDYGVDRATIGITFFTGSAGFVLAGSTAGTLIHRFGTRATLLVGGGAYLVACLYTATRPPFLAFVMVQILSGYGVGVLESVLNAYLAGRSGSTTLLNRLHAFFGVGALLGPPLATRMLDFTTWNRVSLFLALACVPLICGFLVAFPRQDAEARVEGTRTPDSPSRTPERRPLLSSAMRQPAVLLGSLLLAVYVGLELGMGNWGFSYLLEERGQSRLLAGYTVSGYWLGLTVGRFLISPVASRIGLSAIGMMYVCIAGVAGAAALIWVVPASLAASAGLVLLGFFLGPIFPTVMAVVPNLTTPDLVPTAIGVMNAGSVVGGSALPWLAGAIAQAIGVWTLLPFTLSLALLQLLVWWRMAQRMPGRPRIEVPAPE